MKSPIIKIIENGLKLWITSRCSSISSIQLSIEELKHNFLATKVSNVKITAVDVDLNNILFKYINLTSQTIEVKLDLIQRKLTIDRNFNIYGDIKMDSQGLQSLLTNPKWHLLSSNIVNELVGKVSFVSININNHIIELETADPENSFKDINHCQVFSDKGKLYITSKAKSKVFEIPMEESIYIKESNLSNGLLTIKGYAEVKQ
tara:strand:+ start:2281 stop:2892 length:612 start_codon:yes stop_codon:yes gene_type:complete